MNNIRTKIVKPYVAIINPEIDIEISKKMIELAARNCYDSFDDYLKDPMYLDKLFKEKQDRHLGPAEHRNITFAIRVSRSTSLQLVRHRIATYDQRSTRYVDPTAKGKFVEFICPPSIMALGKEQIDVWRDMATTSLDNYLYWRDLKIPKEDARENFLEGLATYIIATFNLPIWLHIFEKRALNPAAQWQIRGVFQSCLIVMNRYFPCLFNGQFERLLKMNPKKHAWRFCNIYRQNLDNLRLSMFDHSTGYDYRSEIVNSVAGLEELEQKRFEWEEWI